MMLTVRDHILQGNYRLKDDRGRALVPTRRGSLATILSAEGPEAWPIVGMIDGEVETWSADGRYLVDGDMCGTDLLPPPPEMRSAA